MTDALRWGVVATGGIAATVTADLLLVPGIEVVAVSSRSLERAQEFAGRFGIPRAYGDYRELLADPGVDVVYVATPHSQHYEITSAALHAGKNVLCEKAFTLSVAHAEELVALAESRGLFLMEAMWTRFLPLVRRLRAFVHDDTLGEIRLVRADFGVPVFYDPAHRLWNPELGGGALLDLGVYPVSFAHMVLGTPSEVHAHGALAPTGVDAEAAVLLGYPDGAQALLSTSLRADTGITASVVGTRGSIDLHTPFYAPTRMTLRRNDREPEVFESELWGNGYTYQAREVVERIAAQEYESPEMPWADTVNVMRTLCAALGRMGVQYPASKTSSAP
ncbi:putative dehydrogenase [Crossiella equi]|uniref:Dehydrogenase n=1 Tax=Crossiella equi TaxID=130796 RepID=A0ABS5AEL7_9PSEU|nr:Gfo/Idh/MocA family oxidoreductase [Crossiella equi]MBP2475024.1 putative dehydrogenase [Crossiella equi]